MIKFNVNCFFFTMNFKVFIIFALLLFIQTIRAKRQANVTDLKLELVQVLFRHGERTILDINYYIYPYLNKSVYEPYGFGQLTNNGKKMMYNVGRLLRKNYSNFLNEKYDSKDVYAYSSEDDRTKMSLELVLAGLYSPTPGLEWNPDLKWMPIPIRYTPKELDILMKPGMSLYFRDLKKLMMETEFLKEVPKFSNLFELLTEVLKRQITPKDYLVVSSMYNMMYVNERLGLPLPSWYTNETKSDLRKFESTLLKMESFLEKQKRVNGGTMIRKFLDNMNLNNEFDNPRKIYLYSGHDMTLTGFLYANNIDSIDYTDFGHTLIFEKYKDSQNEVFVRLLSYSSINDTTTTLRFGECDEYCSIDYYKHYVRKVVATDRDMNTLKDEFNFKNLQDLFFKDSVVKTARKNHSNFNDYYYY